MSEQARPVLIVVVEYGELPEMLRVADVLRDGLGRKVIVFFAKRYYRGLAADAARVTVRGHEAIDWQGAPVATSEEEVPQPAAGARKGGGRWLRALAGDALALGRDLRGFRRRYREVAEVLRRAAPALVVVGQDLIGKELSFALIAANRAGVPTMIVPFAMFSLREFVEYAAARAEHQLNGRPFNRVAAALYPHWVLEHEGRRLLRLPGSRALALQFAGLQKGRPWTPCSEPADAVACDSEVALRSLAAAGVPRARLHVVGGPVHDRLAQAMAEGRAGRDQLASRYGVDPTRPLVVCGWPANIFAWLGGRRIEYLHYAALARAWAATLADVRARQGVEILASVHPKTLDEELAAARDVGIPCHKGGTEQAIAHCDLFVALNGTSITAWAIACGKPVLLYDCYRTGYTDFDQARGCVMVRDRRGFERALDEFCGDQTKRDALAKAQAAVASDWGRLDGQSSQRLTALSAQLMGT